MCNYTLHDMYFVLHFLNIDNFMFNQFYKLNTFEILVILVSVLVIYPR